MKFRRQSARFKTACVFKLACLAVALGFAHEAALAAGEAPSPASSWRVIVVGPVASREAQTQPIPGAKQTQWAAASVVASKEGAQFTTRSMTKEEFAALGIDWAAFSAKTAAAASAELAGLKPELIRDRNQVIECAILRAKTPADDITGCIAAPDLLQRFMPLLGRKIVLAIPDKHTLFLFPRLASRYQDYGQRVLTVYQKSESPVSRELFELSASGLRAIGAYGEP